MTEMMIHYGTEQINGELEVFLEKTIGKETVGMI